MMGLAISIALAACAEPPVREFDPENPYGDGIGRNFHRWRGIHYGTPDPSGSIGEQGRPPADLVLSPAGEPSR